MAKRPSGSPEPGHQTAAEVDTVMRRWIVTMAHVTAKAKPAPKPKRPTPTIQMKARRTNGR